MFLPKILLSERMLDNSAEGSQANRNSPTDMLDRTNIFDDFPEYTNTLMFLPKILLSERMLDNSTEVSGAN